MAYVFLIHWHPRYVLWDPRIVSSGSNSRKELAFVKVPLPLSIFYETSLHVDYLLIIFGKFHNVIEQNNLEYSEFSVAICLRIKYHTVS